MKTDRNSRSIAPFALLVIALATGIIALGACKGGGSSGSGVEMLYSPQNEELDVYNLATGQMSVLIPVDGWVNGQVCLVPDGSGDLLMAEDKDEEQGVRSGWSIFHSDGTFVRKLAEPKSPTNEPSSIDPMGCAFDSKKRLFVTDVGAESFDAHSGKLIMFFPPNYDSYCIISDTLRTAGSVAVRDDSSVLVAESVPPADVLLFSAPYPKDATECDSIPPTESVFIQDDHTATAAGIVRAPNGNWYVSSVFLSPGIYEYDEQGNFVREIIGGPDAGNPEGIAVDSKGTIYYADLGLIQEPDRPLPHPGRDKGTVRKVTFDKDGNPQAPIVIGSALQFPDAVAVLRLPKPK